MNFKTVHRSSSTHMSNAPFMMNVASMLRYQFLLVSNSGPAKARLKVVSTQLSYGDSCF